MFESEGYLKKKEGMADRAFNVNENIENKRKILEQIEKKCFVTGVSFDEIMAPFISKIEEKGLSPEYSVDRDKLSRFIDWVSKFFDKETTEDFLSNYRMNEWIGGILANEKLISLKNSEKKGRFAQDYLLALQNMEDGDKKEMMKKRALELKNEFILHNIKGSDLKKINSFIEEISKDEESLPPSLQTV